MATTLYGRNPSSVLIPLWSGTTFSVRSAARGVTPGTTLYEGGPTNTLSETVGTGAGFNLVTNTVAGPTAGRMAQNETTGVQSFFSAPLAADVTISGTITFDICALESNMSANATIRVVVYRVNEQGALTLIIDSALGTELGTTVARQSWSGTPTSTAMKKGDRLLVFFLSDDATSLTMATGYTTTIVYNGAAASTADSKITFADTLTFNTTVPNTTAFYLRHEDLTDFAGVGTYKMLRLGAGADSIVYSHDTSAGPHTYPGNQWGDMGGGSGTLTWFTAGLNAFTLGGAVRVDVNNDSTALEAITSPFDAMVVELSVVNNDGSGLVVWARSYASLGGTSGVRTYYLTGPDLSITQGQRLRLAFYSTDMRPWGNQAAGTTRNFRYGGTSTYQAVARFGQTITEAPVGPVGSGNKPIVIGRTAAGVVSVGGAQTKAILIGRTAAGTHPVLGVQTKPVVFGRTAAAGVRVTGTASKPVVFGRTAAGVVVTVRVGNANKAILIGRTASGTHPVLGIGTTAIVVGRVAAGQVYDPVAMPLTPSPFRRKRFMPHLLR